MKKILCSVLLLSMILGNAGITGLAAEPETGSVFGNTEGASGPEGTEEKDKTETSDFREAPEKEQDPGTQEVPDSTAGAEEQQDVQDQTEKKENSWRYSDGELIIDQGTSVYSSDAWTKVNGSFVNDIGQVIPNALKKGMDVSHHQGKIDWEAVKNSDIEFVIIRCGFGDDLTSQDDRYWLTNVQECERLGIPYGVYLYSYATTEAQARSEAAHVLRLLRGHSPSYPVYYDMEDDSTLASKSQFARFAEIFCSTVEAAGYDAGIYANLYWWNTYLTDPGLSKWNRWVAQYNHQCSYQGEYSVWQCTQTGTVPGVTGFVDLDFIMDDSMGGSRWEEINGNRYYYLNGTMVKNQGCKIDGYWYYFDEYGIMLSSQWRVKGNSRYYYDADGHMAAGKGLKIGSYWYYFDESGAMLSSQWRVKGSSRYYYDGEGRMAAGKGLKIDGYWYYFDESGAMHTGWRDKDNSRYYYDADGHMAAGKGLKIDGYWYYFETGGAMLRGWREKDNNRYYYDDEGHMAAGKGLKIDGYWYYFETGGAMHTGWRYKDNSRYYYDEEGRMAAGKGLKIDGSWYYFEESGAMHTGWREKENDLYYYDDNGKMVASEIHFVVDEIDEIKYCTFDETGKLVEMIVMKK